MKRFLRWIKRLLFSRKKTEEEEYKIFSEKKEIEANAFLKNGFLEKEHKAYSAILDQEGFTLKLKRESCLVWPKFPNWVFSDMEVSASLSFSPNKSYSATGLIFRKMSEKDYYILLVSSKWNWRLDLIFNGSPRTLIPWTALHYIPEDSDGIEDKKNFTLKVIALDTRLAFFIDNIWIGEIEDDSLFTGGLSLPLAQYEGEDFPSVLLSTLKINGQSRLVAEAWIEGAGPHPLKRQARLSLAQSFAAMDQMPAALVQLRKIWQEEGTLRAEELILAIEASLHLSLIEEARKFIEAYTTLKEGQDNLSRFPLHARLLYAEGKYNELKTLCTEWIDEAGEERLSLTLLAHSNAALGEHALAAEQYKKAAAYNTEKEGRADILEQGIVYKNAGDEFARAGEKKEAIEAWLEAGSCFLNGEEYRELSLLVPQLINEAPEDSRAYALAAKFHFALEGWTETHLALKTARRLTKEKDLDPALPYLEGLLLIREGKREEALAFLEEALELAPSYYPFLFRLLECHFLLGHPENSELIDNLLSEALAHPERDGWLYNLAAQIALQRGNIEEAKTFLNSASETLGERAELIANRAEILLQSGEAEEALNCLNSHPDKDEAFLSQTRAGILYRLDRAEEAEELYRALIKKEGEENSYMLGLANSLIEQGKLGEADEILAKIFEQNPSLDVLELISYVASKKGEYQRAETALNLALDQEEKPSLLFSLAWTLYRQNQYAKALETLERLEAHKNRDSIQKESREELRENLVTASHRPIFCASCSRKWLVPKELLPQPALHLVAEPPEDMPAGTCPDCEASYCIGCAKEALFEGRFHCPKCKKTLKLSDEGIRKILSDWNKKEKESSL